MTAGEPSIGELSVESARARMLASVPTLRTETIRLELAVGRTLALPVTAMRDQPPFDASAMDGWAIVADNLPGRFSIVGESAAGSPFVGNVLAGQAVRVFTGAEVPGDCRVVVQEASDRFGNDVQLNFAPDSPSYVRRRGVDFVEDSSLLPVGIRLDAWRLALAAAAGRAQITVAARPRIAILPTGDEIVPAGEAARSDQIFESAGPALTALVATWGGIPRHLRPAGDTESAVLAALEAAECDLLVTVGGASVGDHDLVKPALKRLGLELSVDTVRVRPGKPVWFGVLADGRRVLGLPGNPASALVCAELFLRPLMMSWQGANPARRLETAQLTAALPKGGPREHWMRGALEQDLEGRLLVTAFPDQESSLVSVFAGADCLIRRKIDAPSAAMNDKVEVMRLERL